MKKREIQYLLRRSLLHRLMLTRSGKSISTSQQSTSFQAVLTSKKAVSMDKKQLIRHLEEAQVRKSPQVSRQCSDLLCSHKQFQKIIHRKVAPAPYLSPRKTLQWHRKHITPKCRCYPRWRQLRGLIKKCFVRRTLDSCRLALLSKRQKCRRKHCFRTWWLTGRTLTTVSCATTTKTEYRSFLI